MGAPHIGVPSKRAGPQLCPHWIRDAWSLHKHRGATAGLHFQGSRGRASTGLLPAMPFLHQDPRGAPASEQLLLGDLDIVELPLPQASPYQSSCMTPRRPSGLGARTRLRGQKLPLSKAGLDPPASSAVPSALPPLGTGARSKRVAKGKTSNLSIPSDL
ncbi:hypothetical protein NDU88_004410 [Pleurodeles waltl]|uniref:Uncharacterized protein n=1 Tax=Pleurodeles waltl TaxID=8319 RepID=A0AAV7RJJ4_PLEWA|nr:hypothetical protein NDU88_004410 [Pleurodeles waltl]